MHNILIVDDELDIRQSLKGVLEDEGYNASVAESGEVCLDLLRKRSFDVILLDTQFWGGIRQAHKLCKKSRKPIARRRSL